MPKEQLIFLLNNLNAILRFNKKFNGSKKRISELEAKKQALLAQLKGL